MLQRELSAADCCWPYFKHNNNINNNNKAQINGVSNSYFSFGANSTSAACLTPSKPLPPPTSLPLSFSHSASHEYFDQQSLVPSASTLRLQFTELLPLMLLLSIPEARELAAVWFMLLDKAFLWAFSISSHSLRSSIYFKYAFAMRFSIDWLWRMSSSRFIFSVGSFSGYILIFFFSSLLCSEEWKWRWAVGACTWNC